MSKDSLPGQLTIADYLAEKSNTILSCGECICRNCLYWWSNRCSYGSCYDDHRAKIEPYDKMYPGKPPRTAWSNWNKPGEQAHWCRGGMLHPVSYCEHFVKYKGSTIEDCVQAPIQIFQDGFVNCSLKDSIGCEACIAQAEGKEGRNGFDCEWMTDTGCERMTTAKNLIIQAIQEGEDIEMCREQCCKGCTRTCSFRCGQV